MANGTGLILQNIDSVINGKNNRKNDYIKL